MNITVMRSVSYLLDTCQNADGPTRGPAGYYVADGTWPGRWRGTGLRGLGLAAGASVGRAEALALFHHFAHPITGAPLGRTPAPDSPAVNGFDLTFRIPKSVSLLWAVAEEEVRQAIWDTHTEAVNTALAWIEVDVLRTRSGRDGVAVESTRGLVSAAFDHFESRDGDPHLHTHVAVANRVQRARDGAWRTIDGRALLGSAVAASELHENLLLDLLHERLGMTFTERDRPGVTSRAVVADAAGVDPSLIEAFSSRDRAVSARLTELTASWSAQHGGASPPRKVADALKLSAWASTRKPKKKSPDSLADLTRRWRRELAGLGANPADLVAAAVGHPVRQVAVGQVVSDPQTLDALARLVLAQRATDHTGRVSADQVQDGDVAAYLDQIGADAAQSGEGVGAHVTADLAVVIHENLAASKATWTRRHAQAAAGRMTRLLRTPATDRVRLTEAITDAALSMCVPLTPTRYQVPEHATAAVVARGRSVFDETSRQVFTSRLVLDAEQRLHDAATTELPAATTGALDRSRLRAHLAAHVSDTERSLAVDQAAAVEHLACAGTRLTAMVGPAGTGKTTSLRALTAAWTAEHGPGRVLALAPSARAASVLRGELDGVDATTLAAFVTANTPGAKTTRAQWIDKCHTRYTDARTGRARGVAGRALAKALTQDASVTVGPGTLVIVDEAAMATTADLDRVLAEAENTGARMVLVGDPAQLDAVGAGGILGRLERTGNAVHLTSVFRFTEPWQADASRRLRKGDATVFWTTDDNDLTNAPPTYADAGWVHDGSDEDMLEGAYAATQAALAAGSDAVLLVATNDDLADLNTRATLERRAAGLVDTTRLVRLRGHADAGAGDVLLARRNDAQVTDREGRPIQNGDLLRLVKITATGQALCRRVTGASDHHDDGAAITLPVTYLAQHTELGYALTAHRAQGVTVDEAHLVIPDGAHMTRELVYVALTRARGANHAWVGLPNPEQMREEHTPVFAPGTDGALQPVEHTAATVLARALRAVGAQSTAHEVADAETERTSSLSTLVAEHEHLAHLAAEPRLRAILTDLHGPDYAETYTTSPAWEALVATFARADALHPERTARLLAIAHHRHTPVVQGELDIFGPAPLTPPTPSPPPPSVVPASAGSGRARPRHVDPNAASDGDDRPEPETHHEGGEQTRAPEGSLESDERVHDAARLAHWTLNAAIVRPHLGTHAVEDWVCGLTPPVHTGPADVVDVARQAQSLIAARVTHLRTQVTADDPPTWVTQLPQCPDAALDPDGAHRWDCAAVAVACYRDAFGIETNSPLGPAPDGAHQTRARAVAADALQALTRPDRLRRPPASWVPHADAFADPAYEWDDAGEVVAPTRREARTPWPAELVERDLAERPETAPDPTVDFEDGAGPVLWEPSYTLTIETTPAWKRPATAATVDEKRLDQLAAVNAAAYQHWLSKAPGSWVPAYLQDRHLPTQPAFAPAEWTSTVDHLRSVGFTETDITDAGLATRTTRGTLIDRFRDRAAVPLYDAAGRIAGFTARANPAHQGDARVPRYLNTPTTALFDKSALLAGLTPSARVALAAGATPVLVEGALDAHAITAASKGLVGLAPCGTALTAAQITAIARARRDDLAGLVVGFDDDAAGRAAAARAWAVLGPQSAAGVRQACWGAKDPADLALRDGAEAVTTAVNSARPLVQQVVDQVVSDADLTSVEGRVWAARAVAVAAVPTLDQRTIESAGHVFVDALIARGNDPKAAQGLWERASTEALLAYSTAADRADVREFRPALPLGRGRASPDVSPAPN
jgi:DNA primase catalytic core